MNQENLGALKRKYDPRDFRIKKLRKLGAVSAPGSIPDIFLPDNSWLRRNYQGKIPTCGAHASSHLNAIMWKLVGRGDVRFSPRYSWIKIKQKDGFPLNAGTDMRTILKSLVNDGSCDYYMAGNDVSLPLPVYSSPAYITPEMDSNASLNKSNSFAFIDKLTGLKIDDLKEAIFTYGAVIVLLKLDKGWWNTKTPTFTSPNSGHFVVADGYTPNSIRIVDSADPTDEFSIKFIDIKYKSFLKEAGVIIDLPPAVISDLKTQLNAYQKVVMLIKQLVDGIVSKFK